MPNAATTLQFTEIPRDLIPTAIIANPRRHVLLYGPPGTGKSTIAEQVAEQTGREFFIWTCTSEGSAASFKGFYMPKGQEFIYHNGPGTTAYEGGAFGQGSVLCINELNNAGEDFTDFTHVLLDGTGKFDNEEGRLVRRHENFQCIATMNGFPEELRPAVLDRFSIRIEVKQPGSAQLATLPADLAQLCRKLYAAVDKNKPTPRFSFRELQAYGDMRAALKNDTLAALMIAKSPEEAQALIEESKLAGATAAVNQEKGGQ